jgi:hypothetical protein
MNQDQRYIQIEVNRNVGGDEIDDFWLILASDYPKPIKIFGKTIFYMRSAHKMEGSYGKNMLIAYAYSLLFKLLGFRTRVISETIQGVKQATGGYAFPLF